MNFDSSLHSRCLTNSTDQYARLPSDEENPGLVKLGIETFVIRACQVFGLQTHLALERESDPELETPDNNVCHGVHGHGSRLT